MPPKIQRSNPAFFGAKTEIVESGEPERRTSTVGALVGAPENATRIVHLPVDLVDNNPNQTRTHFDPSELAALQQSISTHGLQQPIGVRQRDDGRYQLVFGERRLRCVRTLGQRTIACVLVGAELDDAEITVVENMLRTDLNPFEQADAMALLKERRGCTNVDVGRIVGMDRSDVSRTLLLRNLPAQIRDEYEQQVDKPARYKLWKIAALASPDEQIAAWQALIGGSDAATSAADSLGVDKNLVADDGSRRDTRRDSSAVTLSAFSLRVARHFQRSRDALLAFQDKPKRLEDSDRQMLNDMKAAIERILAGDTDPA